MNNQGTGIQVHQGDEFSKIWENRNTEESSFVNIYFTFQSLLRLKEPAVLLRCRKDDYALVDSVLDSAKKEYATKASVFPPEIVIDTVFLPPAPSSFQEHGLFW